MANLKLRSTTSATDPGSTSAKGTALTHAEMDSNFILLQADINAKVSAASPTLTGNTTIDDTIRFNDADDSNYVAVKAPDTVGTNYTLKLPTADGSSGQVLTTDGGGNLSFTSKTVDTTDLVSDTTPQLGGDLDTQSNAITGTTVTPSTGTYGGFDSSVSKAIRIQGPTAGKDHAIVMQQTDTSGGQAGRQNIAFITDTDGSYSASVTNGSGLIYSPLNMQVRDHGHATKTRTTFDVGVPYRGGTGTTITQGSVTGKLLDVVTGTRKIYLQNVSGGSFATSAATTGKVTGTVTAVNSIGTNAVELTYDTDFASTAVESDLADIGFARFSARDVLNTSGLRASEPELHLEAGRIALESNGTKVIDCQDDGGVDIVTRSNQPINITPNGTGQVNMKNVHIDDADGLFVGGPDYADVALFSRDATAHANYSLEVQSQAGNTGLVAGNPAGAFGMAAYADSGNTPGTSTFIYVGQINGVIGDGDSLTSATGADINNGVRAYVYQNGISGTGGGFDVLNAATFRSTNTDFMQEKLKFSHASNAVTIESATTNDNLVLKTNGSTGYIILSNLPTSASGLPTGALYNDGGTLKIA